MPNVSSYRGQTTTRELTVDNIEAVLENYLSAPTSRYGGGIEEKPAAPISGTNVDELVSAASKKYDVPEQLIHSVIKQESNYKPDAVSSANAQGLMQLIPGTAKKMGVTDPFDPAQNIEGGTKYLRQMLDRYDGDLTKALAAYNAGPHNVDKHKGIPPFAETQAYVPSVLKRYNQATAHAVPKAVVAEKESLGKKLKQEEEEYPFVEGRIQKQLKEGAKDVARQTLLGVGALADTSVPAPFLSKEEKKVHNAMKKAGYLKSLPEEGKASKVLYDAAKIEDIQADPSLAPKTFVEKLVRLGPQVASQVTMSVASGGVLSIPFMGAQIIGGTYENLTEQGIGHDEAVAAGITSALYQAPLEQLGIGKATKLFKLKSAIAVKIRAIGESALAEGFTEALQTVPEYLVELFAHNPDAKKLEALNEMVSDPQFWADAAESGALGSVMGGTTSTTVQSISGLKEGVKALNKRLKAAGEVQKAKKEALEQMEKASKEHEQKKLEEKEKAPTKEELEEMPLEELDKVPVEDRAKALLGEEATKEEVEKVVKKVEEVQKEAKKKKEAAKEPKPVKVKYKDLTTPVIVKEDGEVIKGEWTPPTGAGKTTNKQAEELTGFFAQAEEGDLKAFEIQGQNIPTDEVVKQLDLAPRAEKAQEKLEEKVQTKREEAEEKITAKEQEEKPAPPQVTDKQSKWVLSKDRYIKRSAHKFAAANPGIPYDDFLQVGREAAILQAAQGKMDKPFSPKFVMTNYKNEQEAFGRGGRSSVQRGKIKGAPGAIDEETGVVITAPEKREVRTSPTHSRVRKISVSQYRKDRQREVERALEEAAKPAEISGPIITTLPKSVAKTLPKKASKEVLVGLKREGTERTPEEVAGLGEGAGGISLKRTGSRVGLKTEKAVQRAPKAKRRVEKKVPTKLVSGKEFDKSVAAKRKREPAKPINLDKIKKRFKSLPVKVIDATEDSVSITITSGPAKGEVLVVDDNLKNARIAVQEKQNEFKKKPKKIKRPEPEKKLAQRLPEPKFKPTKAESPGLSTREKEELSAFRELISDPNYKPVKSTDTLSETIASKEKREISKDTTPSETPTTKEIGEAIVGKVKQWKNRPNIFVATSVENLPADIKNKLEGKDPKKVRGIYDKPTGKIYLVAENFADTNDALTTLIHEETHAGTKKAFGKNYPKVMLAVYLANKNDIKPIAKERGFKLNTKEGRIKATNEWLAKESTKKQIKSDIAKRVIRAGQEYTRQGKTTQVTTPSRFKVQKVKAGWIVLAPNGAKIGSTSGSPYRTEEAARKRITVLEKRAPTKRKQKSDRDKAILAARKAGRGGKTVREVEAGKKPIPGRRRVATKEDPYIREAVTEQDIGEVKDLAVDDATRDVVDAFIGVDEEIRIEQDHDTPATPEEISAFEAKINKIQELSNEFEAALDRNASEEELNKIREKMINVGGFIGNEQGYFPMFNRGAEAALNLYNNARSAVGDFYALIDVEAPWIRINAKRAGRALKNFFGVRSAYQNDGVKIAADMVRQLRTELGHKPSYDELADVVRAYEDYDYRIGLDKNYLEQIRPAIERLEAYFKDVQQLYKDRGVEMDFLKRREERILEQIEHAGTKKEKQRYIEQWGRLQDLEFVSIPAQLLFEANLTRYAKSATPTRKRKRARAFLTMLATHKRELLSLNDLINRENSPIKSKDINLVNIVMAYHNKVAKDMALLNIRDALVEDKQAVQFKKFDYRGRPQKVTPPKGVKIKGWKKLGPDYRVLNGYKVPPRVKNMVDNLFSSANRQNFYDKTVAIIKMSAFYNPFFLPMYDSYQSLMAGAPFYAPMKALPNILRAFKSRFSQDADYREAMVSGLFSKPFDIPWSNYKQLMSTIAKRSNKGGMFEWMAMQGQQFLEHTKDIKHASIIKALYNTSWNTAWALDETVRMFTYFQMKERGFSSEEAAQTAAKFHGDYASVPPTTRRWLNRFFFTPTFKIVMSKLYAKAIKSALMAPLQLKRGVDREQLGLAVGLLGIAGVTLGFDAFFRNLGYEPENDDWWNFGRRYSKKEYTGRGPKNFIITWTNPANMVQRYTQRFMKAADDYDEKGPFGIFKDLIKWDLHPMFRTMHAIDDNRKPDGSPIWNRNDEPWEIAMRQFWFALNDMIRITDAANIFERIGPELDSRDKKLIKKQIRKGGWLWKQALDGPLSIMNMHATDARQIKISKDLQRMQRDFQRTQKRYILQHGQPNNQWLRNYRKKIKQRVKELR